MCEEIWKETVRTDDGDGAALRRGEAIGLRAVVTEFKHDGDTRYLFTLELINEYGCDDEDYRTLLEKLFPLYTSRNEAIRCAVYTMDERRAEA